MKCMKVGHVERIFHERCICKLVAILENVEERKQESMKIRKIGYQLKTEERVMCALQ